MTRREALRQAADILQTESNVLAGFLNDYEPDFQIVDGDGTYRSRRKSDVTFPPRVFIGIRTEMQRMREIEAIIRPRAKRESE